VSESVIAFCPVELYVIVREPLAGVTETFCPDTKERFPVVAFELVHVAITKSVEGGFGLII
jgi:hypothetical protein